jgi:hypothetical protein
MLWTPVPEDYRVIAIDDFSFLLISVLFKYGGGVMTFGMPYSESVKQ